jgi:putative addiction module component
MDLLWESLSAPEINARETAWTGESERRIDAFNAGRLGARDAKRISCRFTKLSGEVTTRFLSTVYLELNEVVEFSFC